MRPTLSEPVVGLPRSAVLAWLREDDEARLEPLWRAADEARRRYVGDAVHLRGLVEISNYCVRGCTYCGIRAANRGVERYRVSEDVVLACAHKAVDFGYGTLVMQAGEDYGITQEWMSAVLRRIHAADIFGGQLEDVDIGIDHIGDRDQLHVGMITPDELAHLVRCCRWNGVCDRNHVRFEARFAEAHDRLQ
jgi:2-iminoacetate synthase ThiH